MPVAFGAASVAAAPVVVGALGFGALGIAGGSTAASMMSFSWTYGIGVPVISTLQSVGAAGFSATALGAIGTAGSGLAAGAQEFFLRRNNCQIFIYLFH